MTPYRQLRAAAVEIGRAWCGSWLPRYSAHYDRDLMALPLHLRVQAAAATDRLPPALELVCCRWTGQRIHDAIRARAGQPDETLLREGAAKTTGILDDAVVAVVAALDFACAQHPQDNRLAAYLLAVRQIEVTDAAIFVERCRPLGDRRPDPTAEPPPHIAELARLEALRSPFDALRQIVGVIRSAAVHLDDRTDLADGSWPTLQQRASLRAG